MTKYIPKAIKTIPHHCTGEGISPKKIKWLWIDNFNEIKLKKKFYLKLKKNKVKICLVSPELVKKERIKEIRKIIHYFNKNNFKIDAVCTKKPELWYRLAYLKNEIK